MPIPFTCPHCGAYTDVADEHAGQSGPCGKCGQTIIVPGGSAAIPTTNMSTVMVFLVVVGIVAVVCGGILLLGQSSSITTARVSSRRTQCTNNLNQIGLAMHNYHASYGCFPPACLPDENGNPMHSWRVLLLPFLGRQDIYQQYDFDEPWDGPNNQALSSVVMPFYQCPSDSKNGLTTTSYMVIVGPNTVFPDDESVAIEDISDGTSSTIMVVEVSDTNVNWLEPQDLNVDEIETTLNELTNGIRPNHPSGFNAVFCDGSVHFITENIDPPTFDNLIDRQDGIGVVNF